LVLETSNQSQGIQSIEKAHEILEIIAQENKPVSITELAAHSGMSKSKLHKYLVSLCRIGFLSKGRDLKYSLGTELMLLGLTAAERTDIRSKSLPYVLELKEKLNETSALAIWGESGPFFLLWQESNRTVNIGIKVGSRVALTQSATGLIFAAFLPEEKTNELLRRESEDNGKNPSEMVPVLNKVRKQGYATAHGDLILGIAAVAAPVYSQTNELVACLTVVGILGTMSVEDDSPIVRATCQSARQLSYELGHANSR